MYSLCVGFDRGNDRTNLATVVNGNYMDFAYSSMVAPVNMQEIIEHQLGQGNDRAGFSYDSITLDGKSYLFGDDAVLTVPKKARNGFGDRNRYYSPDTRVSLLYGLSHYMVQLYPNVSEVEAHVVMGVPLSTHQSAAIKQNIENDLGGKYTYTYGNRTLSVRIVIERVVIEGTGAALVCGFAGGKNSTGVVDTGSFTTNFLRFNGAMIDADYSRTVDYGVAAALDLVEKNMLKKYERGFANNAEKYDLLCGFVGNAPFPEMPYADGLIPQVQITDWLNEAFDIIGEQRNMVLADLWGSSSKTAGSDFSKVLHVGGGSRFYHDSLLRLIKKAERPAYPELLNARGYASMAERLANARKNVRIVGA
jgi:hypothetical protein